MRRLFIGVGVILLVVLVLGAFYLYQRRPSVAQGPLAELTQAIRELKSEVSGKIPRIEKKLEDHGRQIADIDSRVKKLESCPCPERKVKPSVKVKPVPKPEPAATVPSAPKKEEPKVVERVIERVVERVVEKPAPAPTPSPWPTYAPPTRCCVPSSPPPVMYYYYAPPPPVYAAVPVVVAPRLYPLRHGWHAPPPAWHFAGRWHFAPRPHSGGHRIW